MIQLFISVGVKKKKKKKTGKKSNANNYLTKGVEINTMKSMLRFSFQKHTLREEGRETRPTEKRGTDSGRQRRAETDRDGQGRGREKWEAWWGGREKGAVAPTGAQLMPPKETGRPEWEP